MNLDETASPDEIFKAADDYLNMSDSEKPVGLGEVDNMRVRTQQLLKQHSEVGSGCGWRSRGKTVGQLRGQGVGLDDAPAGHRKSSGVCRWKRRLASQRR